jgi:hypothetical protein
MSATAALIIAAFTQTFMLVSNIDSVGYFRLLPVVDYSIVGIGFWSMVQQQQQQQQQHHVAPCVFVFNFVSSSWSSNRKARAQRQKQKASTLLAPFSFLLLICCFSEFKRENENVGYAGVLTCPFQ